MLVPEKRRLKNLDIDREGKENELRGLLAIKKVRGLLFSVTPEDMRVFGTDALWKEWRLQEEGLALC